MSIGMDIEHDDPFSVDGGHSLGEYKGSLISHKEFVDYLTLEISSLEIELEELDEEELDEEEFKSLVELGEEVKTFYESILDTYFLKSSKL